MAALRGWLACQLPGLAVGTSGGSPEAGGNVEIDDLIEAAQESVLLPLHSASESWMACSSLHCKMGRHTCPNDTTGAVYSDNVMEKPSWCHGFHVAVFHVARTELHGSQHRCGLNRQTRQCVCECQHQEHDAVSAAPEEQPITSASITIVTSIQIAGYSTATFDVLAQKALRVAIATQAGCTPSAVMVVSTKNAPVVDALSPTEVIATLRIEVGTVSDTSQVKRVFTSLKNNPTPIVDLFRDDLWLSRTLGPRDLRFEFSRITFVEKM